MIRTGAAGGDAGEAHPTEPPPGGRKTADVLVGPSNARRAGGKRRGPRARRGSSGGPARVAIIITNYVRTHVTAGQRVASPADPRRKGDGRRDRLGCGEAGDADYQHRV